MKNRIVRNSVARAGGYAAGAAIQFAGIVVIGRYLGTERFGSFAFIAAFAGIFQLLADMGIRNILIRNIAVAPANFRAQLGIARTLLWLLSLFTMVCIVVTANLLELTADIRQAIYLAGLGVLFTFNGLGYSAVLRAFEEMGWDIAGFVLHKIILLGLIWSVSKTGLGLKGVFMATLAANAFCGFTSGRWCAFAMAGHQSAAIGGPAGRSWSKPSPWGSPKYSNG